MAGPDRSEVSVVLSDRTARYLSILGHPFIVIPCSVGAIGVLRGGSMQSAMAIAALFVGVSIAVLSGIKAGRFNDFDVSQRERRPRFYLLLTAGTLALAFWLRHDPEAFRTCLVAAAVLFGCGLINGWTKASLHTAFSLYAAGLWGAWWLGAGLVALPVAAAVAWSRVRLGRHSTTEVVAGAVVGLAAAVGLVLLAGRG